MKKNDYVKIKNTPIYGQIIEIDDKGAYISDYDKKVPLNKLKYIPPKVITENDLRNYFRMNNLYFNEIEASALKQNYICEDTYLPNKEDLLAMLMNLKVKDIWIIDYYLWIIDTNFTFENCYLAVDACSENELDIILNKTDGDLFKCVFTVINNCIEDEDDRQPVSNIVKLDALISLVHRHIKNEENNVIEYDDSEKENYISYIDENDILNELTDQQKQLYKQFVEELYQKNNKVGLEAYAYGCYGGNDVFACDWKTSRDTLERLYNKYGSGTYANSLGYIYYYGRTENGIAQYEKAFKYYAIGAASGIYESSYHLADMFYYGRGVTENKHLAITKYFELYEENKKILCEEFFDCKFADIALRLATVFMSQSEPNYEIAYYYLLQADFAIKKRREVADFYGDEKVQEKITKAIENCRNMLWDYSIKKISYYEPVIMSDVLDGNQRVKLHIKNLKNKKVKMEFTLLSNNGFDNKKYLFTFTKFNKCVLTDKIIMYADEVENIIQDGDYIINEYSTKDDLTTFYLFGQVILQIRAESYTIRDMWAD